MDSREMIKHLIAVSISLSLISGTVVAQGANNKETIVGAVIVSITSILIAIIGWILGGRRQTKEREQRIQLQKLQEELEERLEGLTLPIKVGEGYRRNSIMLLGTGGTGKTSLIRSLFDSPEATPDDATDHYEMYRTNISSSKGKGTISDNVSKDKECTLFYW